MAKEAEMNWRLVLLLSIFGVVMAFAGVFFISGRTEALLWPVIFVIYAVIIVHALPGRYFIHAFAACVINGLWSGIIHAACMTTYLENHHVIREIYKTMPLADHRRIATVLGGIGLGLLMGIIAGLVAYAVGRIWKKKEPAPGT